MVRNINYQCMNFNLFLLNLLFFLITCVKEQTDSATMKYVNNMEDNIFYLKTAFRIEDSL